jgi:mRNA-degrading endonuclease YafQ of YafQ-DinJ toxin-antitoxin module
VKRVELHRSFVKSYAKRIARDNKLECQYEERVDMFMAGHRDVLLKDHPLTGGLEGRCTFSITADIRVIYVELEDKIIFLDIGTHNQVY